MNCTKHNKVQSPIVMAFHIDVRQQVQFASFRIKVCKPIKVTKRKKIRKFSRINFIDFSEHYINMAVQFTHKHNGEMTIFKV